MIDRKKDCWFGSEPEDIAEWLRSWLEDEELDVKPVACGGCGKDVFELEVDSTEGGAQVRCAACGAEKLLLDSSDYWEDGQPEPIACPNCGGKTFQVRVGFDRRADGDVRWVYLGVRCTGCGALGSAADWEINYGPTAEMEQNL